MKGVFWEFQCGFFTKEIEDDDDQIEALCINNGWSYIGEQNEVLENMVAFIEECKD